MIVCVRGVFRYVDHVMWPIQRTTVTVCADDIVNFMMMMIMIVYKITVYQLFSRVLNFFRKKHRMCKCQVSSEYHQKMASYLEFIYFIDMIWFYAAKHFLYCWIKGEWWSYCVW